jgi:acetylornithine/succinyldiaminopimelate/putrescine aminotransferase
MLIEEGIIANATAETVIRLVPPLIIVRDDVDELVRALRAVFGKYTARMSTKS